MGNSETFWYLYRYNLYISSKKQLTPATGQQNKKGRVAMKNKQSIFFVLIPKKEREHNFGGLLTVPTEQQARDLSREIGGAFLSSSYSLN